MHILEIVSFLPPYGGYFAVEQAAALKSVGNQVGMLYCQQLAVTVDGFSTWMKGSRMLGGSPAFDTKGIEIQTRYFRGVPKCTHYNEEQFCKVVDEMFDAYVRANGRPDILHAQAAKWAGVAAMRIAERTGIPYFVTEHFSKGSYEMDFGVTWTKNGWAKELIRKCYENATCVLPVARELVDDTACFFGNSYRYKEISNVTDVDFYHLPDTPREAVAQHPFRFCCLAIANNGEFFRKGYDVLAQTFSKMEGCELHIAGRDTDSERFKQLFEQYFGAPLPKDVILHGGLKREGVRALLYQCDALVLASRSEVQPLVVMEALSTGIPVVGTEVIPQSERIEEGVIITKKDDAAALCEGMKRVMAVKPSAGFHQKVVEISSAQRVAEQLMEVFTQQS